MARGISRAARARAGAGLRTALALCTLQVAAHHNGLSAQLPEFLGEHELVTLPWQVPGTGRIGGITSDAFGYLYVADQDESVWKIHPSGEVERFVRGLYGSATGAVLPRGDLLHSSYNSDRIVRVERDGTVHAFVDEGLEGPVGMAVVEGDVFVVNTKSDWIARVSLSGNVSEFARDERFLLPNGITSDPEGNLYVVNLGNPLVLRVSPGGEVSEVAELPGRANAHVAFFQGALYVTQIWNNAVLRVELDGSYRVVAGDGTRRTRDGSSGESRIPFPNGITASTRGDVLYLTSLDGNMVAGQPGSIQVQALYPPSVQRAFDRALERRGMAELRSKFDEALDLEEFDAAQIAAGLYSVGHRMLSHGHNEAGLALVDWIADVDPDHGRAVLERGRAQMTYGDPSLALEFLQRAVELRPEDEEAKRLLESTEIYAGGRR